MAKSAEDWHYLQTAQRAELPASLVAAVRLMYAGACIAVVFGATFTATVHTRTARIPIGDPTSSAYKAGHFIGGVIVGLMVGGLWLWMARENKRGRSWARLLSTALFGIMTLYAAGGLVALPAVPKALIALEWAAGLAAIVSLWQSQSSLYYNPGGQLANYPPTS